MWTLNVANCYEHLCCYPTPYSMYRSAERWTICSVPRCFPFCFKPSALGQFLPSDHALYARFLLLHHFVPGKSILRISTDTKNFTLQSNLIVSFSTYRGTRAGGEQAFSLQQRTQLGVFHQSIILWTPKTNEPWECQVQYVKHKSWIPARKAPISAKRDMLSWGLASRQTDVQNPSLEARVHQVWRN